MNVGNWVNFTQQKWQNFWKNFMFQTVYYRKYILQLQILQVNFSSGKIID